MTVLSVGAAAASTRRTSGGSTGGANGFAAALAAVGAVTGPAGQSSGTAPAPTTGGTAVSGGVAALRTAEQPTVGQAGTEQAATEQAATEKTAAEQAAAALQHALAALLRTTPTARVTTAPDPTGGAGVLDAVGPGSGPDAAPPEVQPEQVTLPAVVTPSPGGTTPHDLEAAPAATVRDGAPTSTRSTPLPAGTAVGTPTAVGEPGLPTVTAPAVPAGDNAACAGEDLVRALLVPADLEPASVTTAAAVGGLEASGAPALPVPGPETAVLTAPATPRLAEVPAPLAPAPVAPAAPPATQVVTLLAPLFEGPDGAYTLSLQLYPEELGAVQVEVSLRAGEISLALHAGDSLAEETLRAALPSLRAELESAGLTATALSVDRDQTEQPRHDNPPRQGRRDGTGAAPCADSETPTPPTSTADAVLDVRM